MNETWTFLSSSASFERHFYFVSLPLPPFLICHDCNSWHGCNNTYINKAFIWYYVHLMIPYLQSVLYFSCVYSFSYKSIQNLIIHPPARLHGPPNFVCLYLFYSLYLGIILMGWTLMKLGSCVASSMDCIRISRKKLWGHHFCFPFCLCMLVVIGMLIRSTV